ncbi:MAG: hypothetical protein JWQ19_1608 [Subtercola sp.]|nr:hypothetical protein [Subtercola sp.]
MFRASGERELDPLRAELDAHWDTYLKLHGPAAGFDDWLPNALAGYRDEIVHFGAQMLNDLVIREWNGDRAQARHDRYLDEARTYDADPHAWETAFWSRVREALPSERREQFDRTKF